MELVINAYSKNRNISFMIIKSIGYVISEGL